MKFVPLCILTIAIPLFTHAQKNKIDSLCFQVCETLKSNKGGIDSVRLTEAFEKHLHPFFAAVEREQITEVSNTILIRLQKYCVEFSNILDRANPTKGDWQVVDERPTTGLTRKDCDQFLRNEDYKYLEHNGDTVNLVITNDYWIDHFNDGTYSKLKLSRIGDCEIEIEFIESDNKIRRTFSNPGDKYRYQILEKGENYYLLSVEMDGNERISTFKMYK